MFYIYYIEREASAGISVKSYKYSSSTSTPNKYYFCTPVLSTTVY